MRDRSSSDNAFERRKAGTPARDRAEAAIEALRQRGGIFVEAVRATRMAMALTDPTLPGNPIVFANQSFLDLSGYTMEEVLGQQPYFMNGPGTDPEDAARFRRILEQDQDGLVETVQYAKGGRRFGATVLLSAFKDDEGRTLNHFLSWADVTRRVDAEEDAADLRQIQAALRESESKYRTLFETMGQGYCELELVRDGEGRAVDQFYLAFNPAFERLFGIPVAQAKGRRASEIFPALEPVWTETFARVARTGTPERIEHQLAPSGRWFEVFAYPASGDRLVVLYEEVTDRRRAEDALRQSEERQAFLLTLSDALQQLADAAEIQATTARLVGEHLGVDRAMYAEVDGEAGEETGIIRGQYVRTPAGGASPVAPFPERFTFEPFGAHTMAARYRGEPLVVGDIAGDPGFGAAERAAWLAAGVCAAVVMPLAKGGRLVAEFGVHAATARAWTDAEVALLREVAERTWAAAERARAEAALRESEEKYRSVFETIDEGFCIWDVVEDADRRIVDLRFVEVNPAFERQTGLAHVVGRLISEVAPGTEAEWIETYGEVARTGAAKRFEMHHAGTGRWYDIYASRIRGPHGPRVSIVFRDITERRRTEAAERDSKGRQAFLLTLSDALRAEPDADAMALFALRALAERLRLDRCYVAEYRLEEDRGDILYQVREDRLPPLPDSVRLSDFPEALDIARGGTLVIDDLGGAGFLSDVDKRNMQDLGMGALVTSAARKGENVPLFAIVAVSAAPRPWTPGEIALIEEVNERTWAALDRARAEAALAASEAKYRSLFETMGQGYCHLELVRDADGRAVDQFYLQFNPAFERLFGIPVAEATGRKASDIFPDLEESWVEAFERVVSTRQPERIEQEFAALGRWFEAYAYPDKGDRLVVLFEEITDRKRAERVLRESEERQAFLLRLSDALRPVADPVAIQETASRLTAEHLDIGRVAYCEIRYEPDVVVLVERDWPRRGMPSIAAGRYRMDDFGSFLSRELTAGRPAIVPDAASDARIPEAERAHWRQLRIVANCTLPVMKDGRFVACLVAQDDRPHAWTEREIALLRDVSERTWASVERARVEAALRASEERFRLLVQNVRDYAIFTMDSDGLITSWPAGAAAVYGWSEDDILGRSADLTFLPEDVAHGVPAGERETAAREGLAPNVRWHLRKDGSRIFIDGSTQPLVAADGQTREFIKIGQDVTEVRRTQQALAEGEQRLRTLAEGIPQLVWRSGDGGRWTWSSPQWQAFTGQSLAESLDHGWLDAIYPEDRAAATQAWARAPVAGAMDVEYRVRRASDDEYLWHHTRSLPVRNEEGAILEWLGTTTDVPQLKELQERQAVMVAELQHRTRNLIAVVRSIAQQTMAQTGPTEAFRDEFNHRLEALARVQGFLSRSDEEPITMHGLIRLELDALGATADAGRVVIEGPSVRIRHSVVQTLALALHELATNARKYGALSCDEGRLDVRWQTYADAKGERLALEWTEVGGQPPKANGPSRRGYGRELIERALPYSLNARTSFEHGAAGLRCTIDMPLERVKNRRR